MHNQLICTKLLHRINNIQLFLNTCSYCNAVLYNHKIKHEYKLCNVYIKQLNLPNYRKLKATISTIYNIQTILRFVVAYTKSKHCNEVRFPVLSLTAYSTDVFDDLSYALHTKYIYLGSTIWNTFHIFQNFCTVFIFF